MRARPWQRVGACLPSQLRASSSLQYVKLNTGSMLCFYEICRGCEGRLGEMILTENLHLLEEMTSEYVLIWYCSLHKFLSHFSSSPKVTPELAWNQAPSKRYVFFFSSALFLKRNYYFGECFIYIYFFSKKEWHVFGRQGYTQKQSVCYFHLRCLCNVKTEIRERSLRWNRMRDNLETQWQNLSMSCGLQTILKARSGVSLRLSPFIFSALVPVSIHIHTYIYFFYWTSFSQHLLWRMTLTFDLWRIGSIMSSVIQKELVSVPDSVTLQALWPWTYEDACTA